MQSLLRWLTCLALTCMLLVGLLQLHKSETRTAIAEHLPQWLPSTDSVVKTTHDVFAGSSKPLLNISPPHETIGTFWHHWSEVIRDARPTIPAIRLKYSASSTGPSPGSTRPRMPYMNLVQNPSSEITKLANSQGKFLKELGRIGQETQIFNGRGVVIVGGGEYFGPAIISLHMLRHTGSTLPVEIFVSNQDEYNPTLCEEYLPKLNARCRVLADVLLQGGRGSAALKISHYQLKSLALLFSSFAEVLLLDSDSIPLVDPAKTLFDVEPYRSSGLVLWPDFWVATESPTFYTIAGLPSFPNDLPMTSCETGQLLVNKNTHLQTLLLSTYYNIYGPQFYYPLLSQGAMGQGDKETFLAAAVVLNSTYYRVKTPVEALNRDDGQEVRGTAMVQRLPEDEMVAGRPVGPKPGQLRPAFAHVNTPKMNAGHLIDEGDLLSKDGKRRLRLLGPQDKLERMFGFDLEKTVWDLLVQTGCELHSVIREWKKRERLCERLHEHYDAVFKD